MGSFINQQSDENERKTATRREKIEKVTPTSGKIKAKHSAGKMNGDESIFFYIGSIFLSFFAAESSP